MFGYKRAELIGADIAMLSSGVYPYTLDVAIEQFKTVTTEGQHKLEWHCKTKTGVLFWAEISLRYTEFGNIPAAVAIVRDIDERKQSDEKLSEARAALIEAQAMAHVGSFTVDWLNNAGTWSDECYRILGLDPATVVPTFETYLARIHPEDRETFLGAHERSIGQRNPTTLDQRIVMDDGTVRVVQQRWQNYYGDDGKPRRTTGTVQDITEIRDNENVLRQERDFSTALIDSLPGLFVMFDERGSIIRLNDSYSEMTGKTVEQLQGSDALSVIVESDRERAQAKLQEAMVLGVADVEFAITTKTGDVRAMHWSGRRIIADGHPYLVAVGIDVTDARAAESQLRASEERFQAVSRTAQDAIIIIDSAAEVSYWNPAAERILGYTANEAIGKSIHEWLAPQRFRKKAVAGMKEFAASGRSAVLGKTLELAAVRKDGAEIPIELSVAAIQQGTEWNAVAILRDVTERKRTEEAMARMARHDILTGLVNRGVFVEVLQEVVALERRSGKKFALLYLDLDHFKDINDTLGHPVGDQLLQSVAQRLQSVTRKIDTVSRFGGDEFAVIAIDILHPADAAVLADKILKAISEPFTIEGNEIRTGASIGIAAFGVDSSDAETLLSNADVALYRAKSEGRGAYRFFTNAMDTEVRTRVTLGAEIRDAIASDQFFLEYQPEVHVDTGLIIGLEALVRWRHPSRGRVMPDEFIPTAEQNGLIVPLGRWVLQEACRQMKDWIAAGIGPPLVAVNVSALQFKAPDELERDIEEALAKNDLPPTLLEIEITETAFLDASLDHNAAFARLRKSGIRVAIDDFGAGYSSLSYLSRFPVNRIKIGQSFMRDLKPGSNNAKIVKAAIGLSHELGLDAMIEGVETAAQVDLLRTWDCHKVQGFYFSKPLPADEIAPILRARKIVPTRPVSAEVAA